MAIINKTVIPLSEPLMDDNEGRYLQECLQSGWVSSAGPYVDKFEEKVKEYIGASSAVAVVNGTSALHLSLLACGVGSNCEVIVPTLTFIAPVNAVRYCQAEPVFMDCDEKTLGLDIGKLKEFLAEQCVKKDNGRTFNKKTGRQIQAIIPVHVFGQPVNMGPLMEIAQEYGISIIEDAAESLGSQYQGRMTGSIGDVGCLSFNGNKIITCGGGGMVVTQNEEIAARIRHLSTQAKSDETTYDHDEIGFNYRLTNIQAALGLAQMDKLEDFINIKRVNAKIYQDQFSGRDDVQFLWETQDVRSNFWFYTIRVSPRIKDELSAALMDSGIQVRRLWKLIHTLNIYKGYEAYKIDKAQVLVGSCINLPCSVNLKEEQIIYVAECIKNYLDRNLLKAG